MRFRVYMSTPDDSGYVSRLVESLVGTQARASTWPTAEQARRHVEHRYPGVRLVEPGTEPERNEAIAWIEPTNPHPAT